MATEGRENWDESTKSAKLYADTLDSIKKKNDAVNKGMTFITGEMGIAYGSFIKQVKKTNEELQKEKRLLNDINLESKEKTKDVAKELQGALKLKDISLEKITNQKTFNKLFSDSLAGVTSYKDIERELSSLKGSAGVKEVARVKELTDLKKNINDETISANELNQDSLLSQVEDDSKLLAILKAQGVDISNNAELQDAISKSKKDGKWLSEGIVLLSEEERDNAGITNDEYIKAKKLQGDILKIEEKKDVIAKEQSNKMKEQLALTKEQGKAFRKDIWKSMKDYDQVVADAGKNFGFIRDNTKGTALQMTNLNMEAARFGMNTKEVSEMMGSLGDELKTIDQKYLAESVGHFVAISKATGISSKEVTIIAGEMMRAGKSSKDVENYMEGANKTAKMMGVNTKKVLEGVAKNIDKMRTMGFQGGEKSLTKMVATAERLRMNVDEIFNVAKKARTIEGAMEMASELQLAGGSFANIDPMSLLAAARKGPKELQKILTTMGDDIGHFNDEGVFETDAIDADRMQMVADATGQTVDSISKMIQKNAEDNQKLDLLGLDSAIDDDSKNFLADMTKMDKDGKTMTIDPELAKLADGAGISLDGVDDLGDLNQEQITKLMEAKEADLATLEEQAEQNQSFEESMKALKDSFMNIFTIFEPFLKGLTSIVQFFNGSTIGKWGIALAALAFVGIPMLAKSMGKFFEGTKSITGAFKGMKGKKGIVAKAKGLFGGVEDQAKPKIEGEDSKDTAPQGKGETGLERLAKGLKAMGTDVGTVFKGIAATAVAAPALALLLMGMPTLFLMAGVGALGDLIEKGFGALGRGIGSLGNADGIWKGLAVMALVGVALIPFAYAASLMADVNWLSVLAGIGILALVVLGLVAMGVMMTGPQLLFMLYAVGILALVGVALLVFGIAMQKFATGAEMMQGIDFSFIGLLGTALMTGAPGLLLGGIALLLAAPGLIYGSKGLIAIGVAANTLNGIDWAMFAQIGPALMSLSGGLMVFGIAGLMFLNPMMLLGMILMLSNLGMLAVIMTPLAESLNTGADGLDRFAEGLTKLQTAANSLDLERLESLKDLSVGMASSGAGGGMGDELSKIAEAIVKLSGGASGGGKGGGTQKIQVDLKLNGRDLQSIIIDDTEIVS